MPSPRLTLPVLSAILACGPAPATTTTDAATDTTAAGSTSAGTVAPTSSSATTSTGSTSIEPTTTTATTDALTTAPLTTSGTTDEPGTTVGTSASTSTSTSEGTTTGEPGSSTGAPDPAQYAAQYYAGGLDRIFVRKADPVADLCAEVAFVWPGNPSPNLTLPAMWGLQWAIVVDGAAGCLDFQKPLQNGVMATGVTGTATWAAMVCPKTLDLDVVATFPQGQPWVPAQVALQAAAVPIQGC